MSTVEAIDVELAKIKEAEKQPIPTPHIGCMVNWYPYGNVDPSNIQAAVVTKIENFGKVCLTIFPPNGPPQYKSGVIWVKHPDIAGALRRQVRINSGTWDYDDGTKPRRSHDDVHLTFLKNKRADMQRQRDSIVQAEFAKANMKQSGAEGKTAAAK